MPIKNSTLLDEDAIKDDEMEGESYESDTESEEEEEEGDVKLMEPKKDSIYDRDGLGDKLQDISWPENVGWIHKLSIDINQEPEEVDVNDDFHREAAFYKQALEGTRQAFEKLQSMNLPFLRPPDNYAEMVKADAHMVKVRGSFLAEKKSMEEADERRKAREARKLAKEVQGQKLKERSKQKEVEIESVKKWRKLQQSGFADGDKGSEMDFSFEDGKIFEKRPGAAAPGDRSGGKARRQDGKGKKGLEKKQKKREFRNSKFGHGGKKGLEKQNTDETTDHFKAFNKGGGPGNKKRKR